MRTKEVVETGIDRNFLRECERKKIILQCLEFVRVVNCVRVQLFVVRGMFSKKRQPLSGRAGTGGA